MRAQLGHRHSCAEQSSPRCHRQTKLPGSHRLSEPEQGLCCWSPGWQKQHGCKEVANCAKPVCTVCSLQHTKEAIGSVSPPCSRYLCDSVTHSRIELHVSEEQSNGGNCDTPQALSSAKCCKIPVLAGSLGKAVCSFQFVLCIPADKRNAALWIHI